LKTLIIQTKFFNFLKTQDLVYWSFIIFKSWWRNKLYYCMSWIYNF